MIILIQKRNVNQQDKQIEICKAITIIDGIQRDNHPSSKVKTVICIPHL